MKPEARRERLLVEAFGDELVIYDVQRHRAHQLNRTATLIWQSCDGRKTVADLKKVLQNELNPAADEALVWKALDRLGKAHLLREAIPRPAGTARITRRQALGKFGRTAALALLAPVVKSITAPTPVQAAFGLVFTCDSYYCAGNICKDYCAADSQCSVFLPFCRLMPCNQSNCPGCTQRRCTNVASPTRMASAAPGGKPEGMARPQPNTVMIIPERAPRTKRR